jgi:SAM-dependent methyltransferase
MVGGYDDGYQKCPCFWGREPGSLVERLVYELRNDLKGLKVLDVGCGEGKNSIYLAEHGATVRAIDVSQYALTNAKQTWREPLPVTWECADVVTLPLPVDAYDIVIAYGLLHCLMSPAAISLTIRKLKSATKVDGYHVLCAFNNRFQDLSAHPGFYPCLIDHCDYLAAYEDWQIISQTDRDLRETHPHNEIIHTHSLTRILARRH